MKLFRKMLSKASDAFRKMKSHFDKNGSYTGSPDDDSESHPEQDVDDL